MATNSKLFFLNKVFFYLNLQIFLKEFKTALIQLLVTANKQDNIRRAVEFITIAAKNDAKIISLPVRIKVNSYQKLFINT